MFGEDYSSCNVWGATTSRRVPEISFTREDLRGILLPNNDPLVVTLSVANWEVHRVLINQETSLNIMFWDTFNKLELKLDMLKPNQSWTTDFDGKRVKSIGRIELQVTAADRTLDVEFLVVNSANDRPSAYNLVMGRDWIHKMERVPSPFHQVMRCRARDGNGVVDIKGDQIVAKKCQTMALESMTDNGKNWAPEWKKLNSEELGIDTSKISKPALVVLNALKEKGYDVYLVGGCVRDLILKKTPRDFDIITSAELKQVKKVFRRCQVVGKRFPICHVLVDETIVEVSTFNTSASKTGWISKDGFKRPPDCNESDYIRWRNCLQRDFTINGLFFDPWTKIVYDYIGGLEDIRKAKVQTIMPAKLSFKDDCARILRGVRVAAQLGFHLSSDIALSLKELSRSVLSLNKRRILRELNLMLAFGSAEASLRLLWRFGLLEILLPVQASHFDSQGLQRSNMLLKLFASLDRLVTPDWPCENRIWISILAFHKALVDRPQDPFVISAFSSAVHGYGTLHEAVKFGKKNSNHNESFREIITLKKIPPSRAVKEGVVNLAASVKATLSKMALADEYYASEAMTILPQVFIPPETSLRAHNIFECIKWDMNCAIVERSLEAARYTVGSIVYNTFFVANLSKGEVIL